MWEIPIIKTVDEFILTNKDEKCNVIINYPSPNKNQYDYESLVNLYVNEFIIFYGPDGCSGSHKIIELLTGKRSREGYLIAPYESKKMFPLFKPELKQIFSYKLIDSFENLHGKGYGFFGKTHRCDYYSLIEIIIIV